MNIYNLVIVLSPNSEHYDILAEKSQGVTDAHTHVGDFFKRSESFDCCQLLLKRVTASSTNWIF